jgi:adenylate cyclase
VSAGAEARAAVADPSAAGRLLESLGAAVAMADPVGWEIGYENARFRSWFPPPAAGASNLPARLAGIDLERARDRLARGRPYRFDAEVAMSPRRLPVQVELRRERLDGGAPVVVVEVSSIARQKEAEYMLDSYARMMERQAREVERERERGEKLLLNIMPRGVYEELREFGTTLPQPFSSASVLMLDFVDFTEMTIAGNPGALIAELNDVFTSFDRIVDHFHCDRLKTIGDAYMAVGGITDPDPDHATHLAHAALRMRRFLERRNESSPHRWRCRIGIGVGPVIGAIVGTQKYVYDLFGPAVNMAARLERRAEPMQILVCGDTRERISDDFVLSSIGTYELKGFGTRELFSLDDVARPGR